MGKPYTKADIALIKSMALPTKDIAKMLNRTPEALRNYAAKHGISLGANRWTTPEREKIKQAAKNRTGLKGLIWRLPRHTREAIAIQYYIERAKLDGKDTPKA